MKKLGLIAFTVVLASCSSTPLGFGPAKVDVGVSVTDATSTGVVTKTITSQKVDDKGNVTTPASVAYSTTDLGSASFIFQARPGSDAAYITGYRITRYLINGVDALNGTTPEEHKNNIYVGSGYRCAERTAEYSCTASSTNFEIGNGLPSTELKLNFASDLVDVAISTEASASSTVDLEFLGKSSSGADVTSPVEGINSFVSFKVVTN